MQNPLYNFIEAQGQTLNPDWDLQPLVGTIEYSKDNRNTDVCEITVSAYTINDLSNITRYNDSLRNNGVIISLVGKKCSVKIFSKPYIVSSEPCIAQMTFAYVHALAPSKHQYINLHYDISGKVIAVFATQQELYKGIYEVLKNTKQFANIDTAIGKLIALCREALSQQQLVESHLQKMAAQRQGDDVAVAPATIQSTVAAAAITPAFGTVKAATPVLTPLQRCMRFAAWIIADPYTNPIVSFARPNLYGDASFIETLLSYMDQDEAMIKYIRMALNDTDFREARAVVYMNLVRLNCERSHLDFIEQEFIKLNQQTAANDLKFSRPGRLARELNL